MLARNFRWLWLFKGIYPLKVATTQNCKQIRSKWLGLICSYLIVPRWLYHRAIYFHLIHLMTIMISSCTIVTDKAENYRHFKYSDEFRLQINKKPRWLLMRLCTERDIKAEEWNIRATKLGLISRNLQIIFNASLQSHFQAQAISLNKRPNGNLPPKTGLSNIRPTVNLNKLESSDIFWPVLVAFTRLALQYFAIDYRAR